MATVRPDRQYRAQPSRSPRTAPRPGKPARAVKTAPCNLVPVLRRGIQLQPPNDRSRGTDRAGFDAAFISGITPVTLRKRASRARARLREFVSVNCGLVNTSAQCHCDRRVQAALRNGRVQPGHLNFAPAPGPKRRRRRDGTPARSGVADAQPPGLPNPRSSGPGHPDGHRVWQVHDSAITRRRNAPSAACAAGQPTRGHQLGARSHRASLVTQCDVVCQLPGIRPVANGPGQP